MPILRTALLTFAVAVAACQGRHEGPGTPTPKAVPAPVVAARTATQQKALGALGVADASAKQILFGDLHVHTTYSVDAFMRTLPLMQGEGAHPPADACDFARYCSDLDFWSINDHAEGVTPAHWQETKEAIRQCNAVAGDAKNPDLVSFLGWEWTQVGPTPETHYGHKNVIFRDTAEDRVPTRPISARSGLLAQAFTQRPPYWQRIQFPLLDFSNRQRYLDFGTLQEEIIAVPLCPQGVDARKLPADCHETAETPDVLFEKLSQWGFETIVIPHGTTWGFYTPPGSTFDKQLKGAMHDPAKQRLLEVYSGHGNSEEFRPWQAVERDAKGELVCPAPTKDYTPCCWQAGEIIRSRCADPKAPECEERVVRARANYVQAGVLGHRTVPGATIDDWKDCGQCRDCFNPAFNYRPGNSAQYALAMTNFDDAAKPRRFHFGFMASSDNHSARPGTGYKEYGRREMTEATGPRSETWRRRVFGKREEPAPASRTTDEIPPEQAFQALETERQISFFMTGGLVAVHAGGRDRDAVWDALERREVYGTSGERILLWFDLLNGPNGGPLPMGSETRLLNPPRFRVRAVGAFEQKSGCPEHSLHALGADRVGLLCKGECYNPSDRRRLITRIEVVRVRPQVRANEPVRELIEDPWRRFDCPADRAGCAVEFEDPSFLLNGRPAVYYVRAIQEPTPAVNAGGLRCERDAEGNCTRVHPCFGDYRTPFDDDCLTSNEERAWSSPIYIQPGS
ncbi:MAG: DUF3604 domain-containing protein [Candidatus Binatia bacterium]